jgi:hypothetical protein
MPEPKVWDEDQSMMVHGAAIADVTGTPDATYSANEQTLLTDLKTALNSVLAVLRSANLIAGD